MTVDPYGYRYVVCQFCGTAEILAHPHRRGPCPLLEAEHEARLRLIYAEQRLVEAKIHAVETGVAA